MKYFQIRTALLTFALGLASIPFADFLQAKWIESSVELPKVNSGTPIFVRVCPEFGRPWTKDATINCERGGGAGGGGKTPVVFGHRIIE